MTPSRVKKVLTISFLISRAPYSRFLHTVLHTNDERTTPRSTTCPKTLGTSSNLSHAADIIYAVIDLKLHLLCAGPDRTFVASLGRSHKWAALTHCALDYNKASSLMALSICWANQHHTFFSPTPGAWLWASL